VLPVVVTNRGTAEATAPLTVVIVLPLGIQYASYTGATVAFQLDGEYGGVTIPWSCMADAGGATVTCISSEPLRAGDSSQFGLVLEAHPEAVGTNSVSACGTSPSSDPAAPEACAQGVLSVLLPNAGAAPGQSPRAPAHLPNTGSPEDDARGLAARLVLAAGALVFIVGVLLRWQTRHALITYRRSCHPTSAGGTGQATLSRVGRKRAGPAASRRGAASDRPGGGRVPT